MKKLIYFVILLLFLGAGVYAGQKTVSKENYHYKCNRIINVAAITQCNDFDHRVISGSMSKQACYNAVYADLMPSCMEQIQDGGVPLIIEVIAKVANIEPAEL